MKYGNKKKKKKMAVGGVGKVKKMRAGGPTGRRPIPKNVPGGGGMVPGQIPPGLIGRAVPRKRPINPKVPMKMDAEGRRGMKVGGMTPKGMTPKVVSFQDDIKKRFG